MNIFNLMLRKNEIVYLNEDERLTDALKILKLSGYTAVPVIRKDGTYAGTVSEGDFLWKLLEENNDNIGYLRVRDFINEYKEECGMDIYIKPKQKVQIIGKKIVYLSDVAEIFAGGSCQGDLEKLPVFQITKNMENMYLLSVLELVQAIAAVYPKATVSNLGESDILLSYSPQPKTVS